MLKPLKIIDLTLPWNFTVTGFYGDGSCFLTEAARDLLAHVRPRIQRMPLRVEIAQVSDRILDKDIPAAIPEDCAFSTIHVWAAAAMMTRLQPDCVEGDLKTTGRQSVFVGPDMFVGPYATTS